MTIEFSHAIARERIEKALDIPWRKDHGLPTTFGFAPDEGHWTYVSSADAPASFDKLKLAWSLWDAIGEKPKDITADKLRQFRASAEQQLTPLGKLVVSEEKTSEDVIEYIHTLPELFAECDQGVTLVLDAPCGKQFSGREVWDVMLCLGLEYGDGDLFHWINNSGFGDDHFFTVETSTQPGYFIPRRMASGEGDVDDLKFGFSIPRSAEPLTVFDSMVNMVQYAQSRLGGQIVLGSGEPFDRSTEHAKSDCHRKNHER